MAVIQHRKKIEPLPVPAVANAGGDLIEKDPHPVRDVDPKISRTSGKENKDVVKKKLKKRSQRRVT